MKNIKYKIFSISFQVFCLSANVAALMFLAALLLEIVRQGHGHLSWTLLSAYPSRFPAKAGVLSAIVGSILMMFLTALFVIPMGLSAAIYLEEYAKDNRWTRLIKLNVQNLAGIPSIIYGILGLTVFVRGLGLGRSLLAGSLTMALLVLPIVTMASQEALRAIPQSFRLAAYGIGMTRWQTIRHQLLPLASPGILTGIILALSRAIGESAPLIMVGALSFVAFLPSGVLDSFTVLPIQIFNWTARPQQEFHQLAAAAIIVLLAILLLMNAFAIYLRIYFKRKQKSIQV